MSANEQTPSGSGNGNDGNANGESNLIGLQDDKRCKRSDGKQWRCTAASMPDKTVCEKHYYQAKKRAANSAIRASQKRVNRRSSLDGTDTYSERKMDDFEMSEHYSNGLASASKSNGIREKGHNSKNSRQYSPESPTMNNCYARVAVDLNDELARDSEIFEDSYRSYRTPSVDPSRNRSHQSTSPMEYSAASTDVSTESLGQICHQCQRKDNDRIISCLKCNQRSFCDTCISTMYSEMSLEEVEKACPACHGLCNCKRCLRSDNTIKAWIRDIPVLDKLQYLYRLLSAVLPVIKQIHIEQCAEVELEKRLRGGEIDLVRARLKADEQMCCNVCRVPVIDYYRHCSNCSYDMCLRCCQDLRAESSVEINQTVRDVTGVHKLKLKFSDKFPEWEANGDGSIPCPPKDYGGCGGSQSLNLARIFKMNWVAKLVKNTEEMVSGCTVPDLRSPEVRNSGFSKLAEREESEDDDNFVYTPSLERIKTDGVADFEKQWADGRIVIVKSVLDTFSKWDPETIWRDINDISDEKSREDDPLLKAVNCLDGSEFDVKLSEIIKAYGDRQNRETGEPLSWKLKDWPSPSASEDFVFYQRPEFIRRFPFLEYIHPRLGLLNVAAKLPHYSLQNDAGPKILISCGTDRDVGEGDSLTSIHYSMRDMVYLLVHTSEGTTTKSDPEESDMKIDENESSLCPEERLMDGELSLGTINTEENGSEMELTMNPSNVTTDNSNNVHDLSLGTNNTEENGSEMDLTVNPSNNTDNSNNVQPSYTVSCSGGAQWDVFRRQDVPKLAEYLRRICRNKLDDFKTDFVSRPLYEGLFLNEHHKRQIKEEFGVEPWTYEQRRGEAIFIPAGCPFQVENLQSNVQVALDFLCPESVGEAAKLAEEIRCLPNDHEAKLQFLEIGKISLYAASSAIKEVQKLVLDPKLGAELGVEDSSLTKAVSNNLVKAIQRRPQQN